jgi:hypothetical protein
MNVSQLMRLNTEPFCKDETDYALLMRLDIIWDSAGVSLFMNETNQSWPFDRCHSYRIISHEIKCNSNIDSHGLLFALHRLLKFSHWSTRLINHVNIVLNILRWFSTNCMTVRNIDHLHIPTSISQNVNSTRSWWMCMSATS